MSRVKDVLAELRWDTAHATVKKIATFCSSSSSSSVKVVNGATLIGIKPFFSWADKHWDRQVENGAKSNFVRRESAGILFSGE